MLTKLWKRVRRPLGISETLMTKHIDNYGCRARGAFADNRAARQVRSPWVLRGAAGEAIAVIVCIQGLVVLGLAWGEYPNGVWSLLGGLATCYAVIDLGVLLAGLRTTVLSRLPVRVGLYMAQPLICIGYGYVLRAVGSH